MRPAERDACDKTRRTGAGPPRWRAAGRAVGCVLWIAILALSGLWHQDTIVRAFRALMSWPHILLALGGVWLLVLCAAKRYVVVGRMFTDPARLPGSQAVAAHVRAQAANQVLPAWAGDLVIKTRHLRRHGRLPAQRAMLAVIIDRGADAVLFGLLAPVSMLFFARVLNVQAAMVAALAILSGALTAIVLVRSAAGLRQRLVLQLQGRMPRRVSEQGIERAGPYALPILGWTILRYGLFVLLLSIVFQLTETARPEVTRPVVMLALALPLVQLAGLLPVTLNGIGLHETIWVGLLASRGTPTADALGYALALRGSVFFGSTTLAGLSLLASVRHRLRALQRRQGTPAI